MTLSARIIGQAFTFTDEETSSLNRLAMVISHLCNKQPTGWRVLIVKHVTDMHKVIAAAIERAEVPTTHEIDILKDLD